VSAYYKKLDVQCIAKLSKTLKLTNFPEQILVVSNQKKKNYCIAICGGSHNVPRVDGLDY
jgi:hypothetical protein